jgi:hypothetical protein
MGFDKRTGGRGLLSLLVASLLFVVGCGGSGADNKVPENPAPLPDPSERIEG